MDFDEFCAAAISTHQLEAREGWDQIASVAFEHFEQEGNRIITVEELARVCLEHFEHSEKSFPFSFCICLLSKSSFG